MPSSSAEPRPDGGPFLLAVEASRLARDGRGIGRYVRVLLPRLLAQRPGLRLALYVKRRDVRQMREAFERDPATRGRVGVRSSYRLGAARADVFWYPWNVARPAPRRGVVVATVHDIVPVALAQPARSWKEARWQQRWRRLYADTVERATLLVVDSAFTADELRRFFRVPPERMRVVPLAADDVPPPSSSPAADDALETLGVRPPFVLAVGASEPRKNLAVLDRAMPRVAAAVPGATLVLVGPRPSDAAAADPAWKRTLGFVSEAQLAQLYRAAGCVVVPSTYEGFGLPVLEAMRAGTPVVCARRASLPEVGGDAAEWVEPDDDAGIAATITRVLTDERARGTMRAAGLAQAARFTWDETARRTLAALDEARALGERRAPRTSLLPGRVRDSLALFRGWKALGG